MGATTFSTYGLGKDASAAFREAQDRARYDYGHAGYTGSLAEKDDFVTFEMPPRFTELRLFNLLEDMYDIDGVEYLRESVGYARNKTEKRKREAEVRKAERRAAAFWKKNAKVADLLRRMGPTYHDKWGPAVCIEIKGARAVEIKKQRGRGGTHDRVFLFTGYASC